MIHWLSRAVASAALVIGTLPLAAQQPAAEPAPSTIGAVQAKLFFTDGTFSEDMLQVPHLGLWNTPIGEGWAKKPADATLVMVEVRGARGSIDAHRGVELTATEQAAPRRVSLRRRANVCDIGDNGTCFVGFWLYDTGCVPIVLRARLVGQSDSAVTQKVIPFRCGE